jgi:hypothetical protein
VKEFDPKELNENQTKKDSHRTEEYNLKLKIKEHERNITTFDHEIEIINGEVYRLKQEGVRMRDEVAALKTSKTCPTCEQELKPEHQKHIDVKVSEIQKKMVEKGVEINKKIADIKLEQRVSIAVENAAIIEINAAIETKNLEMENVLVKIGELNNLKNDFDKRKELETELGQIPVNKQNWELKIAAVQQKVDNYHNNLIHIEENVKINRGITLAKVLWVSQPEPITLKKSIKLVAS